MSVLPLEGKIQGEMQMNDINGKIRLYQICFSVCVILAFLFLVITVVLYFKLKIFLTAGYLTGRSKKREIEQLEQGIKKKEENFHGKFVITREIMLLHTEEVSSEGGYI